MGKINIQNIIRQLPADFSQHAVRDISPLSCSVFGETHAEVFPNEFGINFSATLWVIKGKQIIFYRSQDEYDNLSQTFGKLYKENPVVAKELSDKLKDFTDKLESFIGDNRTISKFLANRKIFFDLYRKLFAYHQAVYWGGEYLSKHFSQTKKTQATLNILNDAYKYNEMIIPRVEDYFDSLGIGKFFTDEFKSDSLPENIVGLSNRSILFLGDKRVVLNKEKALEIEKQLQGAVKNSRKLISAVDNAQEKKTITKGVAVFPGSVKGKVRVVTDLSELRKVLPEDIVITPMTRPQYNRYIKHVKAIITDEGGMLCHAAIVAREHKIPCVVGTKVATQALKNGDEVEVNADKGIIRKLNQ